MVANIPFDLKDVLVKNKTNLGACVLSSSLFHPAQGIPSKRYDVVVVYHVTIVAMDMGCWRNFSLFW